MEKYRVVVFRLLAPATRQQVRETGGGVVFLPEPRPENWHALVAALVERHFKALLGPCIELGFATLDPALLERHCQREGDLFWQGGDSSL